MKYRFIGVIKIQRANDIFCISSLSVKSTDAIRS